MRLIYKLLVILAFVVLITTTLSYSTTSMVAKVFTLFLVLLLCLTLSTKKP